MDQKLLTEDLRCFLLEVFCNRHNLKEHPIICGKKCEQCFGVADLASEEIRTKFFVDLQDSDYAQIDMRRLLLRTCASLGVCFAEELG